MATVTCQGPDCEIEFEARTTAKYHSDRCRKSAARKRASSKPGSVVDQAGDGSELEPTAETMYGRDILEAVRKDLQAAGRLETVDGRVAMYLARKSIDPDCKNPAAMFKEMRAALATAIEGATPDGPAPAAPAAEPDKVADIRKKREQKAARQASPG